MKSIAYDQVRRQREITRSFPTNENLEKFRQALRQDVFSGAVSPKEMSQKLRINYKTLANSLTRSEIPLRLSMRHLPDLEKISKNYAALECLATICGFSIYKLPRISANKSLLTDSFEVSGSWGNMAKNLRKYFTENDKNSAHEIIKDCEKLIRTSVQLRATFENSLKKD